ncbi:SIMPL domain-containing protein [Sphingomonas sp.]|uniref:SIMPL domain-containing protein n=1 Tax=Sphingomonas sp. TaxID=28214 RepID=UPI002DD666DB|nr:SIMPL domain-containing protein [Sphingomonas sp.]
MVGFGIAALLLQASSPVAVLAPGETLLEVQAEGRSIYLPDTAFVSVGVVSTGVTAREATDANARQMASVIAALKKAGVEDRHIRTQQISVQPRFARANPNDFAGQPQITGYVANNGVSVTVTKLATAPDVIAAAFGAGANSVSGPNLGAQDRNKGVAEARADAVASAQAEADAYAKSLGMRVARVIRVSERGTSARPMDYVVTASRSYAVAPPAPPPPPPTPVAGGQMERSVTLWIDFALTK